MSRAGHQQIGRYRLLRLVRAGHSCQVWEAIRDTDQQRLALKSLQEEYRRDRRQVALLKHEYAVGQTLDHPQVIRIYEFNVDRGIPYLVMEYFNSQNLKQWMRTRGEEDQQLIPTVIEQRALGLGYVHENGWVHCDVKPDNFLIGKDGHVKLIDFAITRRVTRGLGRLLALRHKLQGTRSYMSPEQIRREPLDQRTDIYSFGCLLFELLAGRPPYTGFTADDLLQKHLRSAVPSLLGTAENVNPDFASLVAELMAKRREDRPESVDLFLEQFRQLRSVFLTSGSYK